MWTLLRHPDQPLPTVISRQDLQYPNFILKGYVSVYEGTRAECETKQEEFTAMLVSGMGKEFWGPVIGKTI